MKKIISMVLAVIVVLSAVAMFAACSNKDDKVLIMATNAAFPPYEFKDGETFKGIDVEIAEAIAKKLDMTLEIKDVEFGSIIGGVQSGKYDIGMAGMTVTDERKQSVNFTDSYAKGVQVVIVKADSTYTSVDDFFNLDGEGNWVSVKDGVKIGVQQDTTGDIYSSSSVEEFGFGEGNVTRYKTGAEAVMALSTDKVTAVIIDNEPAQSFVSTTAGLKILDGSYADEDYAICIAKDNTELLEKVNSALKELIADGTVKSIIDKYINKGN